MLLLSIVLTAAILVPSVGAEFIVVGNYRVSALSTTLVRIEPKGPNGFEDRSTFNVVGRLNFSGIPIKVQNSSATETWLSTSDYLIKVPATPPPSPPQCLQQESTDASNPERLPKYKDGVSAESAAECCGYCTAEPDCAGWIWNNQDTCWPLKSFGGTVSKPGRTFGATEAPPVPVVVTSLNGDILWNGTNTGDSGEVAPNLLHWPAPLNNTAYAFEDRPRFHVPPWGPTPIPPNTSIMPELNDTNGYDFTNDVAGDTYVFLLGNSLETWWSSRGEFLALTGPTPILPDFAYGIWYTWYIMYTEQRAKDEIGNWTKINLPLDVWGLDMNWRETGVVSTPASVAHCRNQSIADPGCRDHFYNHPNLTLVPGLASPENEWFDWLKSQNLRTYFNDHPFPIAKQTTPEEVNFRYNGISEWIGRGLSYWWFDHNWAFTVPGPRQPFSSKDDYEGLSGQVYGSHIYYEATAAAYAEHGIKDRPIALSRDNGPNWKTEDPMKQTLHGAGSPAHHRYPVWWTGDGVSLYGSVQSMVNEAVHDFRAFVHSDCGGHGDKTCRDANETVPCDTPNDTALLRWTAHCSFGTIMRFHQGDHRFWLRAKNTQDVARNYLNLRYKLAPSLISAGRLVQSQGMPLTARCDLFWPQYPEASDPTQYIHVNATLVAPLDVEPVDNISNTRTVWIPPGEWSDIWTGEIVTGPKTISVTKPPEQIPAWFKRGSVLVTDGTENNLRLETQDWSELIIEAFPSSFVDSAERLVYEQEHAAHPTADPTVVTLSTHENGSVSLSMSATTEPRSWVVRLNLKSSEYFVPDSDSLLKMSEVQHITPMIVCDGSYFPLIGQGSAPPCHAGSVAEFKLSALKESRSIQGKIIQSI